jgi:hypothetical protein
MSLIVDGKTHKIAKPVARIGTRWPEYALAVPLRGPLESALVGRPPPAIEIGIMRDAAANQKELPDARLKTDGLRPVAAHLVSPILLMFFERYMEWLKANLGDVADWPDTLNFARFVRNTIAHGKIRVLNPRAADVQWRDLRYGYTNNGAQVIGKDIQMGEMLALMFDTSKALDEIGAPIL